MKNKIIVFFVFVILAPANTFATSWAIGHAVLRSNTKVDTLIAVESATRLSLEATKAAVGSKEQVCIGSIRNKDDTHLEKDGNSIKVYTFYSFQNASCKQVSLDENWVREQVSRLISML